MKKYIIISILLLTSVRIIAQKQTELARFIILEAVFNGVDYTDWAMNGGNFLVFYELDGELCFANVRNDGQSFGEMSSLNHKSHIETVNSYKKEEFTFRWQYRNTYDNKKGSAMIELIKIYKPQAIAFELKMITEEMNVNIYKGYMEGSLNMQDYINR